MTLEQKRAAKAFEDVTKVEKEHGDGTPGRKSYGTFALKLPALLKSAGLCQAVHFLDSRPESKPMAKALLGHLAGQLERVNPAIQGTPSMLDQIRKADLGSYLRLSREAVAIANWYSRLARSVLKVQPGEDDSQEVKS